MNRNQAGKDGKRMFQTKERGKHSPGGLEQAQWGLDQAVQWT